MHIARTERFKRAYKKLQPRDQERARKAIELLLADMRYPSLQAKRIQGTAKVWEARISLSTRMTFELDGDTIILRNIGEHDPTLKNP